MSPKNLKKDKADHNNLHKIGINTYTAGFFDDLEDQELGDLEQESSNFLLKNSDD